MAYCTLDDVRALNPKRVLDSESTPTRVQAEGQLDKIAAEIDVVLSGRGVTIPVTAPDSLMAHLKQVNAYGAAGMIEMTMFPATAGVTTDSLGSQLWAIYRAALEGLRDDSLPSEIDPPFGSDRAFGPASYLNDNPTIGPKFTKEQVF